MKDKIMTDVAVVGGGASGMAAAISIAEANPTVRILIAERLDKVGRKILSTGNGRCNLSNRDISEKSYHGSVEAVSIIKRTPSAEEFFKELGLLCYSDEQGRIYPRSNSASSVLNALRIKISDLQIPVLCGIKIESVEWTDGDITLSSGKTEIHCKRVIIAAGGYAAPALGTDGDMLRIFRNMGYKTAKICPALAPLKVSPESVKGLKGVRVRGKIAAVSGNKIIREETGEIQFTDKTVSGICVFNLARIMSQYEGKLKLRADLVPDMDADSLEEYLCCVQSQRFDFPLEELLTGLFVKNLSVYLIKKALDKSVNDKIATLKYSELQKLVKTIKSLEFDVSGCSPWQNAQVTGGGIHADCLDENLNSKLHPGIYFAGEIVDVDGDCGGFNLQWAWSSGIWAGKKCAESLRSKNG